MLAVTNMSLAEAFCEKTLYLLQGQVRDYGRSGESINKYIADIKEGGLITSQIAPT